MTTPPAPRAEDDPHLDWHSDARAIMDAFANDIAYRHICGTQVELLRYAAAAGPRPIPASEAEACYQEHCRRCTDVDTAQAIGTFEEFIRFLTARVMLRTEPSGDYAITSVGRDFLRFVDERALPERPL